MLACGIASSSSRLILSKALSECPELLTTRGRAAWALASQNGKVIRHLQLVQQVAERRHLHLDVLGLADVQAHSLHLAVVLHAAALHGPPTIESTSCAPARPHGCVVCVRAPLRSGSDQPGNVSSIAHQGVQFQFVNFAASRFWCVGLVREVLYSV